MKLVILDRDGVINHDSSDFIKSPDEWKPLKGSLEAITRLSQAGYHVVVVTNQSGIGRGLFSADTLGEIHVRMIDYVQQHGGKIQSILFCPHHPDDDCRCRKPLTGMYEELASRLNINYGGVFSVGVKTGNGKKSLKKLNAEAGLGLEDTLVFENLSEFADALLKKEI